MIQESYTISAERLRSAYVKAVEDGENPCSRRNTVSAIRDAMSYPDQYDDFLGASPREIATALREGYNPKREAKLGTVAYGGQEILTPQIDLNEDDGDLLVDQVLQGEDFFYAKWDHVPTTVGARLRILWNTLGCSSADVLNDYYDWSLSIVDALKARGNAPSVELRILNRGCLRDKGLVEITIPLGEAGKIVDSVAWRAFLSPGAYRSLGFLSHALIADDIGTRVAYGHGRSQGHAFGVAYDPEEGIVDVVCPKAMPNRFPVEDMDRMLEEVLQKI